MSLTEDSSGREEIATYERISLNNLLLKSKGAPYEDALRRIIEVRLQQNLRVLSLRESPVDEVDSYPHSSLPPEKKPSSQEINIEDIPSTLVSHQHTGETQICQGEDFMSDIVEHGSVYGESMCSGSTSSASKDEFQRWMLKNNGLDLHHEDQVSEATALFKIVDFVYFKFLQVTNSFTPSMLPQCQSWLRHISRVHQGSALPIRGAESRSSSERSKCRNVNRFEGSDNSINRSSIAQMQQSKCTRVKGQSSLDDRNRGSDAGRPQPSLPLSLSGGQRSNPIDEEKIYLMNRSCPNCDQSDDCSSRSFSSSHRRRSGSECGDAVSSTTTDSASSSRSSSRGKVQELRVKQSSCRLQDGVTARCSIEHP